MMPSNQNKKNELLVRVNTRIFKYQDAFIKAEAKNSKGTFTEGEITRQLLDEAINNRKAR